MCSCLGDTEDFVAKKLVKGPTCLQAIEVNEFALWLIAFCDNGRDSVE
jgi:hypothetical protein